MTKDELRANIVRTLEDMKQKAIDMNIEGVAVAAVLDKGETVDWIGEMKVVWNSVQPEGRLEPCGDRLVQMR